MKQNVNLTRKMAATQEAHAAQAGLTFRIYTENVPDFDYLPVINRYFIGATLYEGHGVWNGKGEPALVIEILGTRNDTQAIADLAGDIRELAGQSLVLVSWTRNGSLNVGENLL